MSKVGREAASGGTPRTPEGTPRTSRDSSDSNVERLKQRDQRQSSLPPPSSLRFSFFLTFPGSEEMIVSEILSDIDTSQISRMKQEFDKRGGSVSLIEFLQLFRDTLLEDSARPNFRQLVGKLRTLFEEIDINGDMDMTWEEFTSYVVLNGGNRSRSEHSTQHVNFTFFSLPPPRPHSPNFHSQPLPVSRDRNAPRHHAEQSRKAQVLSRGRQASDL